MELETSHESGQPIGEGPGFRVRRIPGPVYVADVFDHFSSATMDGILNVVWADPNWEQPWGLVLLIADPITYDTDLRHYTMPPREKRAVGAALVSVKTAHRMVVSSIGIGLRIFDRFQLTAHSTEAEGIEAQRRALDAARTGHRKRNTPKIEATAQLPAGPSMLRSSKDPALATTALGESGGSASIKVGRVIDGKIEILGMIGRGGMGTVLDGRHRLTGRRVAVKVLPVDAQPQQVRRLLQEALATGRIHHPNVVDLYDAGEHENVPYLVMERLEGESLAERLQRKGRLPISEAVEIVRQAAMGVHAGHRAGVIHRDLKPHNIFITRNADGELVVKVLDFGISKLTDIGSSLTKTGAIVGTPFYVSPEQISSPSEIDERTDVYGLGVVLYEILTGDVPFHADSYPELINKILTARFPSASACRNTISRSLERVLARATSRNPSDRQSSAAELAEELRGATL